MNFFQSENISLRTLEPSDLDYLYAWENDVSIWHLSNTQKPFSKHVLESFIDDAYNDIFANKNLRLLICNRSDEIIGAIDLFDIEPFHQRAGIGILIASNHNRQKGYASEALKIIIKYSTEVLLLNQLYCNINADNTDSINLFTRNNFQITGNKKSWNRSQTGFVDELFLQLLLNTK